MYERYFQLRERPFALSPDPDYLYPSRVHQEALSYLRYGVEGHAGFVVITGEIGSGKTTMLQSLLGRLDRNTTVARIVNTMLDPRELLEAIMLDFGMDPTGLSKPVLLHRLGEFLVHQRQASRLTLLVIDEAQNLSLPALEEIRMLSNLETEKSKLIQIILIGQPELRDKLALPLLEQLRQRITVSYHLQPLDAEETHNYINHRLRRAAIGPSLEFPSEVTDLIHARSRGVPRIINVIADATLLFAYGVDRRDIDQLIVSEALEELDATGVLASYHAEGGHPEAAAGAATGASAQAQPTMDAVAIEEMRRRDEEAKRRDEDVRRRDADLRQREQQLALREQALATQQRVMQEEARLLAAARNAGASGAAGASGPSSGSRIASGVGTGTAVAAPAAPVSRPPVAPAVPGDTLGLRAAVVPAHATTSASVAPRAVAPKAPAAPAARVAPHAPVAPVADFVMSSGVRVQRFQPPAYQRAPARYGMWERLRRVLFGVAEPEV